MQIMKGYHCRSDSVNLRVLHSLCLCVSQVVCMLYAADTAGIYGGCGTTQL